MRAGSRITRRGNRQMQDKVLAVISLGALIAFMGIVLVYINEMALWIIVVTVLVMAAYDFYIELRGSD